jgi:hypothetical protein
VPSFLRKKEIGSIMMDISDITQVEKAKFDLKKIYIFYLKKNVEKRIDYEASNPEIATEILEKIRYLHVIR